MTREEIRDRKSKREAEKLARKTAREATRRKLKAARAEELRVREMERRERVLQRQPLGLTLAAMAMADRDAGYKAGTFVSWDLSDSIGERTPAMAIGVGHQQGYLRAGRWATRTSSDMLGYGQSMTWCNRYDDGVYANDGQLEAQSMPETFAVPRQCAIEDAIEPEDLVLLRDAEFDRTRDRLASRVGRYITDGAESYHTYEANNPEEWAMAVEEASGRSLATHKPLKEEIEPAESWEVDIQHGFRKVAVTITDTTGLEGNILRMNGEGDSAYQAAVQQLAKADILGFFRFVEQLDDLENSGYDPSRVRKAIMAVASRIVLTPEQKYLLRQRMGDSRKRPALQPLIPALGSN
ncbi:MAG: hypothetical protein Q7S89_03300 [bacterium]|nr:hypothetical protein [bacterium]